MAREHATSALPWGTLEELLLVCAVNRHGTKSWDSVAVEVQNRSSAVTTAVITPQDCRDKFDDLKRRFQSEDDSQSDGLAPIVDELRRLRVEELRREVRRRDVSIVSLELKVKRLEGEREQGSKEDPLPRRSKDLHRGGEDRHEASSRENLAGKLNAGGDFVSGTDSDDRENRSFNESNSTGQRGEAKANGFVQKQAEEDDPGPDRNQLDPIRTGTRPEPNRDSSANGKAIDDDDEENNQKSKKGDDNTVEVIRLGESNELGESMGESKRDRKRGRAASKQNSDVQSSASLSKRRRRGGGDGGGSRSRSRCSSGEEAEGDEVSPATSKVVKLKLIKHEPLIKVLSIVRSHRLGSVFERRLRSQESERYKTLIRQHMDLNTIQSRLNKGVYTDCTSQFFRDLLLVLNNAVVFFRKTSPEHIAAREVRSTVLKEMEDQLPKPQQPRINNTAKSKVSKIESDGSVKPGKSSIIACGLRSSANTVKNGKGGKKEKGEGEEKEKANNEKITGGGDFVKVEDKGIRKSRTKESAGKRGSRTSNKNAEKTTHEYGGNELSSHDGLELEKKENVKKKQGAAKFLKRMKVKEESSEVSEDGSKDTMEKGEKKTGRKKKMEERKERVTRSSAGSGGRRGGKREQESGGRGRRGRGRGGRPPRRPESVGSGRGKRGRENGEADDQVGSAGMPRKRTRK